MIGLIRQATEIFSQKKANQKDKKLKQNNQHLRRIISIYIKIVNTLGATLTLKSKKN
jgi:hypothetical protein